MNANWQSAIIILVLMIGVFYFINRKKGAHQFQNTIENPWYVFVLVWVFLANCIIEYLKGSCQLSEYTFLNALRCTRKAITLDFLPQDEIAALLHYHPAVNLLILMLHYSVFILCVPSVLSLSVSLLLKLFSRGTRYWFWKANKSAVLIIGSNPDNQLVYRSIAEDKEHKKSPLLCIPSTDKKSMEDIPLFVYETPEDVLCSRIEKMKKKSFVDKINCFSQKIAEKCHIGNNQKPQKQYHIRNKMTLDIIINTHSDEEDLSLAVDILNQLRESFVLDTVPDAKQNEAENQKKRDLAAKNLSALHIYVYTGASFASEFLRLQEHANGILDFINKYQQIAEKFVMEYPLTRFLTPSQQQKLVENEGLFEPEFQFSTLLIGFGETNENILKASFICNQFLEKGSNPYPSEKKVAYHIFDRNSSDRRGLNHDLWRYQDEFHPEARKNTEEYFPIPEFPATIQEHRVDFDSREFYQEIQSQLHSLPEDNSICYIVIAFGSDLENLDMARKLQAKLKEWHRSSTYLFAKIRSKRNADLAARSKAKEISDGFVPIYLFGREDEDVFSSKSIFRDTINDLAKKQHAVYHGHRANGQTTADYSWFSMDPTIRASNRYVIMDTRLKLHLMGYDYLKKGEPGSESAVTEAAYYTRYAGAAELPTFDFQHVFLNESAFAGMKAYRRHMVIQEHSRWNAYMISRGFVPLRKDDIQPGMAKADYYTNRVHPNLASIEGLWQYEEKMAEKMESEETQKNPAAYKDASELEKAQRKTRLKIKASVIPYDFDHTDRLWKTLDDAGYAIIQRPGSEKSETNAPDAK